MRYRNYLMVAILILSLSGITWAGVQEEVDQSFQQRLQAIHAGNAEAVAAFFAEDATMTPSGSPFRFEGREAIRTYYEGLFRAFPAVRVMVHQRTTQFYNNATAVTSTYYTVTLVDKNEQARRVHARSSVTRINLDGKWLIANQHMSQLP
ncbi:MAG: SgcJ/EcaC family oxidoreductase [Candidatus Tectomicrobia bacterium]|nr:SgcJ/EcaC family oxidoreductase [Candidatus Tectomicrobia bacterium]